MPTPKPKVEPIIWEPKKVKLADLIDNPKNPKIITEVGKKRLKASLAKFGLADTLIANLDMEIINGHSRKEELIAMGETEVWVNFPSRLLTEAEYKEFNFIYDAARAGEPDMVMVEEVMTEEVMEEYALDKPEKGEIKEIELKPFKQTHVLLSFPPEKMIDIQPYLQKITDMEFVEYEQASN